MASAGPPPDALYLLRGHKSAIACVVFLAEDLLASGDGEGVVKLWSLKTRRAVLTLHAHEKAVLAVGSIDDSRFFTQGRDHRVKIWRLVRTLNAVSDGENKEELSSDLERVCEAEFFFELHAGGIGFCRAVVNGDTLVVSDTGDTKKLQIWSLQQRKVVGSIEAKASYGMAMCAGLYREKDEGPLRLLVGYEDGSCVLYDVGTRAELHAAKIHAESVMCLAVDPKSLTAVTGSADEVLVKLALLADDGAGVGEPLQVVHKASLKSKGFNDVHVRGDGRVLIAAGWDGKVRFLKYKSLTPLCVLIRHTAAARCIATAHVPSHGYLTAVGSNDTHISIWNVYAS